MGINKFIASFAFVLLASLMLICGAVPVSAESAETAENITHLCDFHATNKSGQYKYLCDKELTGQFVLCGDGSQTLTINLNGSEAGGVYIKFSHTSAPWILEAVLSDDSTVQSEQGQYGYVQEYVELPKGTVSFNITTEDGKENPLEIAEIEVYSPGTLPDNVHIWEPTPSTAEIMFVSTHQDDEILFFGGAIPYYSGELRFDTLVVYSAFPTRNYRIHEALEGLWTCGVRQHPIFLLDYEDILSGTIDEARETWDEAALTDDIAELMLKHRPQVVVTQDENGEYGHGQHCLTVHCVKNALQKASDADYVAEKFPELTPWTVSKCYLHLYPKNNISMPWDKIILESAGGKSAFEVACDAFQCHASQARTGRHEVSLSLFDCRSFGLYHSTVGIDSAKNDFFENVPLRFERAQPVADSIPDSLVCVGEHTGLYRWSDSSRAECDFLRYCTVNGNTGWYCADYTGSLLEPSKRIHIAADDLSLNISDYETLMLINEKSHVYLYRENMGNGGIFVRFCDIGTGKPAFYKVDPDGILVDPIEEVAVYTTFSSAEDSVDFTAKSGGSGLTLLSVTALLACATAAIVVPKYVRLGKRNSEKQK